MANSRPYATNPPVPVRVPLASVSKDRVTSSESDAYLEWRACQLNDNPDSGDTSTTFFASLDRLVRSLDSRSSGIGLDAEDAWQEVWLVLLTHRPFGEAGCDMDELPPRLLVIIRNHLADLVRRARRRRCEPLSLEEADSLEGREADPAEIHDHDLVREQVRRVLDEARDRLSALSHRIIQLRGIEERSYEEIAVLLDMPIARVRDRHRRAIADVRDLFLRRFGFDPSPIPTAKPETVPPDLDHREVTP